MPSKLSITNETIHGPFDIDGNTLNITEALWSDGEKCFDVYLGAANTGVCLTTDYSWSAMPSEEDMRTLLKNATCERCTDVVDDIDEDAGLCPKCVGYNDSRVIL